MEDDGGNAYSGVREHDHDKMFDRVGKEAGLTSENAITAHKDNNENGPNCLEPKDIDFPTIFTDIL